MGKMGKVDQKGPKWTFVCLNVVEYFMQGTKYKNPCYSFMVYF